MGVPFCFLLSVFDHRRYEQGELAHIIFLSLRKPVRELKKTNLNCQTLEIIMKSILNNPYRITGLLVGATAREQDRQVRRLKQYIEAEQEPDEDYSFPILGELPRTIADVENAVSKLNLDSDKMSASLFWFYKGNAITDEPAFEALKDGDIETANQIWDKLITDTKEDGKRFWKPVTEKNYSAFHNCAVLNIVRPNGNLNNAIAGGIFFLESDLVHNFVSTVADSTYKPNKKDLQLSFLNQLFSDIEYSKKISVIKFVEIVSKLQFSAKQDFLKSFVQKPIEQVERLIEESKTKRKANKAKAVSNGNTLYQQTSENLKQLKSILGTSDIKFSSISDKVANEILQCSIDYFNDSQEKDSSSDYAETAMKLAKLADSIAVGNIIKDRIKDSISTLEEMKDRELSEVVVFLKSVKDAYEENEREIREQVKMQERFLSWNQTINWTAVEQNIRNSINWSNVNDLLVGILTDKNLKKIKESDKTEAKKEFWELMNWTKDNSLKSSVLSTTIDKYKNIAPKLCFEILSAEVTNTDNKPFYIEDTRYIGLKLKIHSTGTQKVTVYKKYINPEGKYNHNSKSSPEGYTTSTDITIKPETKEIDLGGWGNEKKCTYEVGEHKIEIYVEHYKILTKTFRVDWSPNKKSELTKNLELLQNELSEVEKFKWFRSSETKQKEVKEVQDKIRKAKQILMNK